MDKIDQLRTKMDEIDEKVMRLLNERYDISVLIGLSKSISKKEILDQKRESVILNKTTKYSHYPQLELVYKTIISESKNIQRK